MGVAKRGVKQALGLEAKDADLRRLGRELADARSALAALQPQLRDLGNKITSYEKALEGDRACPECGQKAPAEHLRAKRDEATKRRIKLDVQAQALARDVAKLAAEAAALEKRLSAERALVSELERVENAIDIFGRDLKRLREQANPHDAVVEQLKKKLDSLNEEIDAATSGMGEEEYLAGVCAYWVDAFREIRLSIIDRVLTELEMACVRHAEGLGLSGWRVKFETERTTKAGTTSTAFATLLYPPDADEPVRWESYSGGESQRWQMAAAFGLSEVLLARAGVEPNVEVLDEPTRGLSPEGIDDLLAHLAERAEALGKTIYVTEHHSLDRGVFTGTITVERRAEGSVIVE